MTRIIAFLLALLPSVAWGACSPSTAPPYSAGCEPVVTSNGTSDTLSIWQPGPFPASANQIAAENLGVTGTGTAVRQTLGVWTGYLSGATDPNPFNIVLPGVFTNTKMNTGATALLGGINLTTEYQAQQGANYGTQAVAGGVAVPSGSTVYTASGVAGYANNASTTTAAVALSGYARALASGVQVYGANLVLNDQNFAASNLIGGEIDIGAGNTATPAYALSLIGAFPNGTPTANEAISISTIGSPNNPWRYAILSQQGASANGILMETVATGNSQNSQPVNVVSDDASDNPHICGMQGIAGTSTGNLQLTCTNGDIVMASPLQTGTLLTTTNCSSNAAPAVCGSASAGSVAVPTGTNPTLIVNTTAVTANSQVLLTSDESLGTRLSVTCNTTITTQGPAVVTARTAGTSFTVEIDATVGTNPVCLSYHIIN